MKNIHRALLLTLGICLFAIVLTSYVQLTGEEALGDNAAFCSYLDPLLIDILAIGIALFLIIEGFARIFEHPQATLKRQFTRFLRVGIGFAILTIHVLQFMHK